MSRLGWLGVLSAFETHPRMWPQCEPGSAWRCPACGAGSVDPSTLFEESWLDDSGCLEGRKVIPFLRGNSKVTGRGKFRTKERMGDLSGSVPKQTKGPSITSTFGDLWRDLLTWASLRFPGKSWRNLEQFVTGCLGDPSLDLK